MSAGRAAPPTYQEIHAAHRARVARVARALLRDPDEAEDVEQDVFLTMYRELQRGAGGMDWEPWLVRVTVNACRDRRRSGWWRLWRQASDALDEGALPGAGRTPEEAALGDETERRIWRAWRRLPARQREVFLLREVEGLSTDEVADALGLHPGSVKRHLYRAVLKMRAALGGER